MYPYLFGNEHIPTYGVCFIVGMVISVLYSRFIASKDSKVPKDDLLYAACFALVGGIIGAKLLSILTSLDLIIPLHKMIKAGEIEGYTTWNLWEDIIKNGFVFYGGFLGGAGGYLIYSRVYKLRFFQLTDNAVQSLPLGHAFGRIGCLMAGCCYGRETHSHFGIVFTHPADPYCPTGVKLYPTQLMEAIFCFLLFIFILVFKYYYKKKHNGNVREGMLTMIYLFAYGTFRYLLEFLRGDPARRSFFVLSTSQWISILLVLGGFYLLAKILVQKEQEKDVNNTLKPC